MTEPKTPRQRKDHDPEYKLQQILGKTKLNGECLEWLGNYFKRPGRGFTYPFMYFKGKAWRGNRLVLFLFSGSIPDGLWALHICDNMKCVNPKHLYWGTSAQNVKDTYDRSRAYNQKITHCAHGHEFNSENTFIRKRGRGRTSRSCRICQHKRNSLAWAKTKSKELLGVKG